MGNCNRLESTNIEVIHGEKLIITVIPFEQFRDYRGYELCIGSTLPPMVGTEAIYIKAGDKTYYCLDHAGNIARAGRLRGHERYRLIYGSDGNEGNGAHFDFIRGLKCMRYSAKPTLLSGNEGTGA